MAMGEDSRIVWVERGLGYGYGEGVRESGAGLSWPREGRRGKSGMVQWVKILMYLMDKHLCLIIVLV